MRRYEIEALLKNFLIFFLLQALLLWIIYIKTFNSQLQKLHKNTLERMKLCSYTLDCKEFTFDFEEKSNKELVKLYYNRDNIYSLFHMPGSNRYYLKLSMGKKELFKQKKRIKNNLIKEYSIYTAIIALLSLLFSFYSLYPLKKALKLNDEFIKDILHDYNTPISSIVINIKLLQKELKDNYKLNRIANSIETMLMLQKNLKFFLQNSEFQSEEIYLDKLLKDRVDYFKGQFSKIDFQTDFTNHKIRVNKEALIRVLDNLLSNAAKHNIQNGFIKIYNKDNKLYIQNSAKVIKNSKNIFDRYYKESQRGLGIGLDIVKKLSKQMQIEIDFSSKNGIFTIILDFNKVTLG